MKTVATAYAQVMIVTILIARQYKIVVRRRRIRTREKNKELNLTERIADHSRAM